MKKLTTIEKQLKSYLETLSVDISMAVIEVQDDRIQLRVDGELYDWFNYMGTGYLDDQLEVMNDAIGGVFTEPWNSSVYDIFPD